MELFIVSISCHVNVYISRWIIDYRQYVLDWLYYNQNNEETIIGISNSTTTAYRNRNQ